MTAPVISIAARRAQRARTRGEAERFVRRVEQAAVAHSDPPPAPRLPPPPPRESGPVPAVRERALDALDEIAAEVLTPAEQAARVADRAAARAAKARAHLASLHRPADTCAPLLSELRTYPVARGPQESA